MRTAGQRAQAYRVLIVDDAEFVRTALATALRDEGNVDVACARNGWEAEQILRQSGPFDAVIVDAHMPIADGPHFLRNLTSIRGESPFIIVLASSLEQSLADECLALGANRVLPKPLDLHTLKLMLRQAPLRTTGGSETRS